MEVWGATAAPYPNRFLTVEDFWVHGAWTPCLFLYCLSQPLPTFGSHIIIHRRLQPGVICHRAMAVYVPYREKGTPYESSDRVQGTYRQIRVLFRRALPEWWVIKHHGGTAEKYNAPHTTTVLVVVLSGDYCAVVSHTDTIHLSGAFSLTIVLDTIQVLGVLGVGGSEVSFRGMIMRTHAPGTPYGAAPS